MDDFVMVKNFTDYDLGKLFNIDKSNCIRNGKINNDHLFEIFGRYSDEDAKSVHSDIIKQIETGKEVYITVVEEFFTHCGWNFQEWALACHL